MTCFLRVTENDPPDNDPPGGVSFRVTGVWFRVTEEACCNAAAATGEFDVTGHGLGGILAGCGLRSLHRAYEAAPHAYRRAGEGSTLFWHGTCAAHEKASPSLHAARTLDVGRSTSCRRKCQHTGVPVLEEDRVLGGDRAPGVRVCPDTDVPGHCGADPIQWLLCRPPASLAGCIMGSLCAQYIRSACGYPLYMRLRKAVCKGTILPSLQGIFCCCLCRQVPHFLLREHHYPL